mgnify:CR=1 FL=1
MLVSGSDFYCGNSSGSPCQFALKSQIPSQYVHPTTKQCNYSVDLSGYAKSSDLNSLKTSVSNGKSLIASAITDKGVSTASDATFQTMANNISSIVIKTSPSVSNIEAKNLQYKTSVSVSPSTPVYTTHSISGNELTIHLWVKNGRSYNFTDIVVTLG